MVKPGKSATWNGCDTFLAGLARLPDLEKSLLSFEARQSRGDPEPQPCLGYCLGKRCGGLAIRFWFSRCVTVGDYGACEPLQPASHGYPIKVGSSASNATQAPTSQPLSRTKFGGPDRFTDVMHPG
jgi:hypothetical protein